MAQTLKKIVVLFLGGLFLLAQSGCADVGEAPSSTPVSQPAGTTAGASAGVEVIRQPTAEVISTGPDGFAPDDLEVITPENADQLRELAVIGPGRFADDIVVSPDGRREAAVTLIKSDEYDPASAPEPESFVTHPVLTIWDRDTDEAILVQPLLGHGCGEYDVGMEPQIHPRGLTILI